MNNAVCSETNSQDTEEEQVPPETFVNLLGKAEHHFCLHDLDQRETEQVRITACSFLSGVIRTKIDAEADQQNPPGDLQHHQGAYCSVCAVKKTASERRKKTRVVSRSALVGGILGQIRALWLKDRVQSPPWKKRLSVNKLQGIFGPKTALVQKEFVKSHANMGVEMRATMAGRRALLADNVLGFSWGAGVGMDEENGRECWKGENSCRRTRPDKLERDLVLKNLPHCQKEVCALFERMRHLARKQGRKCCGKSSSRIVESTLQYTISALFFWVNGTGYLKFLESCFEEAAHVLTKQLHRCSESVVLWKTKYVNSTWDHNALYGSKVSEMWCTAGRRSTHSTKMMRSGLRRAAGRRGKRVTSCCCTTADGKESTGQYKNRPHLFETGAKQWTILGTCWRAYGTVNDKNCTRMTRDVTDSVHRCLKENGTGWVKNTAGRRSTHSTKMMRSGLRRAAGRRAKRVTSCCCTTADGKESTGQYKNRPHLFETGAKQWTILGTCWRAYGTNDSGRDRFCASLFKGKWHRMGKKNSLYMRAV
ncbi:hypothetical protein T4C_6441 [Trichinella pseudospiralis]|uniref:Uncharacterized protein n=1 Tax=Trichinella pseudospiralis TaxID=6337 RepID=A0A0V1ISA5_TRIPS|nr:hypothetical protein T4C_6441 [Trichinella pseudospiralis]